MHERRSRPELAARRGAVSSERFRHLPERIGPAEFVETHDAEAVPDPTMGRDPERDFMLRNAGLG